MEWKHSLQVLYVAIEWSSSFYRLHIYMFFYQASCHQHACLMNDWYLFVLTQISIYEQQIAIYKKWMAIQKLFYIMTLYYNYDIFVNLFKMV